MIGALSFVICTTGDRDSFLDEVVLPAILEQPVQDREVLLVGRYGGRLAGADGVRPIEAPVGRELLHKPFQRGALEARHEWIVDMDDDFVLAPDWYERLAQVDVDRAPRPMVGFPMVNPDGSLYGTWFDAVDNSLSGSHRGRDTYFSCYVAQTELFHEVPYPTYHSGDRAHVQRLAEAGLPLTKVLADGARVMNGGQSIQHEGLVQRTPLVQARRWPTLRRALAEHGLAWMPFADAFVDGRPDVTLEELLSRCDDVSGHPNFRRRRNWLL